MVVVGEDERDDGEVAEGYGTVHSDVTHIPMIAVWARA